MIFNASRKDAQGASGRSHAKRDAGPRLPGARRSPVCPAAGGTETRAHVLTPLRSAVGRAQDDARGAARGASDGAQPPGNRENDPLWQEAYQKGTEDARRQAQNEILRAAEALTKAAEQLRIRERNFLEQIQRDILRLSLAIARQVVMAEMKTNPDALGEMIAGLLDEAEDRKVVAVRLHPEDAARFASDKDAAQALEKAGIAVRPSPEVGPGGAILETGFGKLDARLETRLGEIAAALLGDSPDGSLPPGEAGSAAEPLSPERPAKGSPWRNRTAHRGTTHDDESGESLWENQPAYSVPFTGNPAEKQEARS